MREILFRAKRIDNGEWVRGYYYSKTLIHAGGITRLHGYILTLLGIEIEVISETVSQYTGLTDKNGKKIFEGDIVKTFKYNETQYRKRVYFFNGCFFYGSWNWTEFRNAFRGLEVIGNIFDNPELIKE